MRLCTVEGCDRNYAAKGYCSVHYQRMKRAGALSQRKPKVVRLCAAPGCDRGHQAKGLCQLHYNRVAHHGTFDLMRRNDYPPTQYGCKWCRKCETYKALSHFSKLPHAADGLNAWCNACMRDYQRARKAADPDLHQRQKAKALQSYYANKARLDGGDGEPPP